MQTSPSASTSTPSSYRSPTTRPRLRASVPKASVPGVLKMVPGAQVVGEVVEEPGAFLGDLEIT